jgi:hypothetical protein
MVNWLVSCWRSLGPKKARILRLNRAEVPRTHKPSLKIAAVINHPEDLPGTGEALQEGSYTGLLSGRTDVNTIENRREVTDKTLGGFKEAGREYILTLSASRYQGKEIVISPDQLKDYGLKDPGNNVQNISFKVGNQQGTFATIDSIKMERVFKKEHCPQKTGIDFPTVRWRTFLLPKPQIDFPKPPSKTVRASQTIRNRLPGDNRQVDTTYNMQPPTAGPSDLKHPLNR